MRRHPRWPASVLAVALTASLAACSSDGTHPDDGTPPTVGFVHANAQLQFSLEMAEGFTSGVQDVGGVRHEVAAPPMVDGPAQVKILDRMRSTATDGISVFTLSPALFAAPMAQARQAGVPMIAVDNPPPASSDVTLFVGNDNYEMGRQLAAEVIAQLPADATGKIVIGTAAPGVPVLDQRVNGMRDEFRARRPGIRVLGPFDTKQDLTAMARAWQALVHANPTALAFLGTAEGDGATLARIRRETGGTWTAAAFDLNPDDLTAVKQGGLVLMSPEHFVKGAIAGRLQAEAARTGQGLPEGWLYTPGLLVNHANIDDIIARQASVGAKRAWFAGHIDRILGDPAHLRPLASAR